MDDFLSRLFGRSSGKTHPLQSDPREPSLPRADLPTPAPVNPKVLAIIHNPVIRAKGSRKAQIAYGWQDPDKLAQGYIDDLKQVSAGYLNYQVVERLEVNAFPVKKDGFR